MRMPCTHTYGPPSPSPYDADPAVQIQRGKGPTSSTSCISQHPKMLWHGNPQGPGSRMTIGHSDCLVSATSASLPSRPLQSSHHHQRGRACADRSAGEIEERARPSPASHVQLGEIEERTRPSPARQPASSLARCTLPAAASDSEPRFSEPLGRHAACP